MKKGCNAYYLEGVSGCASSPGCLRSHLHKAHMTSVVPVVGLAAELLSSHSTHCWKCAPPPVDE